MSSWLFVLIFATKLLHKPLPDNELYSELGDYVFVMKTAYQVIQGSYSPFGSADSRKNRFRQKEVLFYYKSVNIPVN